MSALPGSQACIAALSTTLDAVDTTAILKQYGENFWLNPQIKWNWRQSEIKEFTILVLARIDMWMKATPDETTKQDAGVELIQVLFLWTKVFSRSPDALPLLVSSNAVSLLVYGALTPFRASAHSAAVFAHSSEAAKALLNVLLQVPLTKSNFIGLQGVEMIIKWLDNNTSINSSTTELKVVLVRIIFLVCATQRDWFTQAFSVDWVHAIVNTSVAAVNDGDPIELTNKYLVAGTLKCLFLFGKPERLVSQVSNEETAVNFALVYSQLGSLARSIILRGTNDGYELLAGTINILFNTPAGCGECLFNKVDPTFVDRCMKVERATNQVASSVTERHWDPDHPGEETVIVKNNEVDQTQLPEMSTNSDVVPRELTAEDGMVLDKLVVYFNHVLVLKQAEEHNKHKEVDGEDDTVAALTPIMTVFIKMAKYNKYIRRYLKSKIIPRGRNISIYPIAGTSIRALATKLLTHSNTTLNYTVGELLFLLCNSSASRLVRRVGFGNAAGFLSSQGIVGVDQVMKQQDKCDSDTESEVDTDVNPVTGMKWPEKHEPEKEMSDEQKEVAAHELLVLFDKMDRLGIMRPQFKQPPPS
eukprot:m.41451 g.41451  ORF g.41451 m.41451 type:complete len:587 (+) comp18817_c1_seq1:145-1905(+)